MFGEGGSIDVSVQWLQRAAANASLHRHQVPVEGVDCLVVANKSS
jgi:hypothetical protein